MCVRACKSKEGSIPKHRNTHIHQTHLSKHKSLHAHAIHPPQETYHSCAKVIRCTNRNWHAKKESLHPQPKALVKQVQHSHQANQVCLLCVQQIQTHLIICSQSFSDVPHGTCVLSVPIACLPLHDTYHPLSIPTPRSVTQQIYTVHKGLHMTNRILTLIDALFQ